jgi:hypothetical protein
MSAEDEHQTQHTAKTNKGKHIDYGTEQLAWRPYLHICAACCEELLVDVVAVTPHSAGVVRVVAAALVVDLAEQPLHTTTLQYAATSTQQRVRSNNVMTG